MITLQNAQFSQKKVLVRVDFNVPFDENKNITDDTRIRASLPTILKIMEKGGIPILMSHLGRPKGKINLKYSLAPIQSYLEKLWNDLYAPKKMKIIFCEDCIGKKTKKTIRELEQGQICLLENLRFYPEEEIGDKNFAKKLSSLGDVYVNDAFGSSHRVHASTSVIADYFSSDKKMFGLLMEQEVASCHKILTQAQKPFTAIIGGAKVSDKILILKNLLNKADSIIIGGGMAYTFLKSQGYEIGKSIFEKESISIAHEILTLAKSKKVKIVLPIDHHVAKEFSNSAESYQTAGTNIDPDFMALDIGEKSIRLFQEEIEQSKTILWNGPMGVFEFKKFQDGSKQVALAIAKATEKGAFSLIGGGDSVSAINLFHLKEKISYVSTGGGALLEFFEGKKLPGVECIL